MIDPPNGRHRGLMANGLPAEVNEERISQVETRGRSSGPAPKDMQRGERMRQMVDANFDFIWRSLRRMGLLEADADDATQEVFVVASRRLDDIAPGRERAFLFGAAVRVASAQRRKAHRRLEQLDGAAAQHSDLGPNPEETLQRQRARARLDQVLQNLSLEQRVVFVLFELEQMTAPEIAALLEIPVGTVASRLRRAREAFCEAVKRLRASDEFTGRSS